LKILLFGKNGQIGWELQRSLSVLGEVVDLGRNAAQNHASLCGELADLDGIAQTIRKVRPNIVVNAAAYTSVDRAETEVERAQIINVTAPGVMAQECEKLGAWIIHYSSDYVFDGTGVKPWREINLAAPICFYGKQNWMEKRQSRMAQSVTSFCGQVGSMALTAKVS